MNGSVVELREPETDPHHSLAAHSYWNYNSRGFIAPPLAFTGTRYKIGVQIGIQTDKTPTPI